MADSRFNGGVPPFILPETGPTRLRKDLMNRHGNMIPAWDGARLEDPDTLQALGEKTVTDKMKAVGYKEKRPAGFERGLPLRPRGVR